MRWVIRSVAALAAALVVASACSGFQNSALTTDAGTPDAASPADAGPVIDAGEEVDPTSDAEADADAGPPIDAGPCALCRSHICDDDGGCHPFVFVTVESYQGDFNALPNGTHGTDRADELCRLAADAGDFRAMLSTSTLSALTKFTAGPGADRPLHRADGVKVADSYRALFSLNENLDASINEAPNGALIPPADTVWTGTDVGGTYATNRTCRDWLDDGGTPTAVTGAVNQTDNRWYFVGTPACSETHHIYCFEITP